MLPGLFSPDSPELFLDRRPPVGEVILRWISAQVGKRQSDY
jgi:hypothetical protein